MRIWTIHGVHVDITLIKGHDTSLGNEQLECSRNTSRAVVLIVKFDFHLNNKSVTDSKGETITRVNGNVSFTACKRLQHF